MATHKELSALEHITILQNKWRTHKQIVSQGALQLRGPRPRSVIRTGCIPCLQAGVKCDPADPYCRRHQIAEHWKINHGVEECRYGSWRERRGFHFLVHFVNAPARTGLFKLVFWHDIVVFACLHNEELHSLGSALGMLYEYVLKKSDANNSSREPFGADTLPLALSQCDRAIEGLKVQTLDPGTALIACVLLIFFEALQGRTNEALIHCMQGRNLLKNLYEDRTRRFINPEIARPAIEGLELQARCVPGVRTSETPLEAFRVLRLPECTRLYNLDQAHQTLHAAYLSLLTASKSFKAGLDTYEVVMAMAERQNRFSPWLDKWEQLFDEFLSQGVCDPDNRKTNILKVNLLTMKILANIDLTRRGSAWNPFVSHFRSITDLSASVLQVCGLGTATTLSTIRFPFMNFGLWVAESLFFTMARCPNYEIRWQAGQLLLAQPYRSKTARSRHSPQPQSAFPLPGDKTDSWTVEDWITFTDAAPIDHGLAVFFGGFQRTSDLIRYHH